MAAVRAGRLACATGAGAVADVVAGSAWQATNRHDARSNTNDRMGLPIDWVLLSQYSYATPIQCRKIIITAQPGNFNVARPADARLRE